MKDLATRTISGGSYTGEEYLHSHQGLGHVPGKIKRFSFVPAGADADEAIRVVYSYCGPNTIPVIIGKDGGSIRNLARDKCVEFFGELYANPVGITNSEDVIESVLTAISALKIRKREKAQRISNFFSRILAASTMTSVAPIEFFSQVHTASLCGSSPEDDLAQAYAKVKEGDPEASEHVVRAISHLSPEAAANRSSSVSLSPDDPGRTSSVSSWGPDHVKEAISKLKSKESSQGFHPGMRARSPAAVARANSSAPIAPWMRSRSATPNSGGEKRAFRPIQVPKSDAEKVFGPQDEEAKKVAPIAMPVVKTTSISGVERVISGGGAASRTSLV